MDPPNFEGAETAHLRMALRDWSWPEAAGALWNGTSAGAD
jgi:hypothetical protein